MESILIRFESAGIITNLNGVNIDYASDTKELENVQGLRGFRLENAGVRGGGVQ